MTADHAHPILLIELPVPAGREAEWSDWYEGEHIPDFLATVAGAVRTTRYRLVDDDDDGITYIVVHEFETVAALTAFKDSQVMTGRLAQYTELWGAPAVWRRRGFEPVFRATASH